MRTTPSLSLLRRIKELRDRGYGWKRIVKELGLGVSYRTVARWYSRYSRVLEARLTEAANTGHNVLSTVPANKSDEPEDDLLWGEWGRLGRTQKLVLQVILSCPEVVWTAAMVWRKLGLMRYSLSYRAVYAAMLRLAKRGILVRVRDLRLVEGEVIRGGFRLVKFPLNYFDVHNFRVGGRYVVPKGSTAPLGVALVFSYFRYGEEPITGGHINNDIPFPPEVIEYLRGLGWRGTLIYPKERVVRVEHHFYPNDLTNSLNAAEEIERRMRLFTSIVAEIISYEVQRLGGRVRGRGFVSSGVL